MLLSVTKRVADLPVSIEPRDDSRPRIVAALRVMPRRAASWVKPRSELWARVMAMASGRLRSWACRPDMVRDQRTPACSSLAGRV